MISVVLETQAIEIVSKDITGGGLMVMQKLQNQV